MMVTVHARLKKQMIQNVCVKSLENKKVENVTVDYTLKSNDERVVVNDYIENDPLSENNLDNTLNLANEFRLSSPQKSIWLYTGFTYEEIMKYEYDTTHINNTNCDALRQAIICQCDVLVGGRYIDSQRDITFPYRDSQN